jgi:integrase/recombinase XerD
MPENLLSLIERYYKRYKPLSFLFESYAPGSRYSAASVASIVKAASKKVGIKKDIAPHALRHTFATHMLEKGVNLKRLQLLMGHNSIKTTSIYLHLANIDNVILPDLTSDSDMSNGQD